MKLPDPRLSFAWIALTTILLGAASALLTALLARLPVPFGCMGGRGNMSVLRWDHGSSFPTRKGNPTHKHTHTQKFEASLSYIRAACREPPVECLSQDNKFQSQRFRHTAAYCEELMLWDAYSVKPAVKFLSENFSALWVVRANGLWSNGLPACT